MPRRQNRERRARLNEVPSVILERARPPVGILLGSPGETLHLVDALQIQDVVCYQMDLYPARRLEDELADSARVVVAADLWDLQERFKTLIYLPASRGERELKIDVVEQAYHVLEPNGKLIVWSPYRADDLFPALLKKLYGKVSDFHERRQTVLIAQRPDKERPRRRHELTFQARILDREPCRFLSRPGTFSYGKLDNGARALMEAVELEAGQRVLDLGCGCGTNGVFAAQQTGESGHVTFVDGNVRAAQLTEHNAKENGLQDHRVVASIDVDGPELGTFDVVLTNPPYYAHASIARTFVERAWDLLRPGGTCFLVTRQPNEMGAVLAEAFDSADGVDGVTLRGYVILQGRRQ